MTIEYEGKKYTVGNTYTLTLRGHRLKENPEDERREPVKIRAKLVLKKYEDGEMHSTEYHYGFVFEYPRIWRGVKRIDEITLPDALGGE